MVYRAGAPCVPSNAMTPAKPEASSTMKDSAFNTKVSRRKFLAAAGAAIALPSIIPSSVLGRQGNTAPSNRVTLGVVGWGMQGPGNTNEFLHLKDCQVV